MEQPQPRCDGCGGNLEPWEEGPVVYDCFHAVHAACAIGSTGTCPRCYTPRRPPITPSSSPPHAESPAWSESTYSSDVSPPPSHVDQFRQTPSSSAPAQPLDTAPFGHPPPPPANTFQPPPAAQFGPQPPLFQHYSHHAGHFGPRPSFAPPPQHTQAGQFGCPPASSQPSQGVPLRQPPPHAFEIPPPPQPVTASSFNPSFRPMHQPLPPPAHYPAFQTSTPEYQQQQPACLAYAPAPAGPPRCAACGGAVVRGQTAVTSQCSHTFHFTCFTVSAYGCPACGAQWGDVGPVMSPPPPYRY